MIILTTLFNFHSILYAQFDVCYKIWSVVLLRPAKQFVNFLNSIKSLYMKYLPRIVIAWLYSVFIAKTEKTSVRLGGIFFLFKGIKKRRKLIVTEGSYVQVLHITTVKIYSTDYLTLKKSFDRCKRKSQYSLRFKQGKHKCWWSHKTVTIQTFQNRAFHQSKHSILRYYARLFESVYRFRLQQNKKPGWKVASKENWSFRITHECWKQVDFRTSENLYSHQLNGVDTEIQFHRSWKWSGTAKAETIACILSHARFAPAIGSNLYRLW